MTMESDDDLLRFLDRDEAEAVFRERRARADDDRPETRAARSPAISLMITQRQRGRLRDLGFTEDAIRSMTPAEAHERLRLDGREG
ncbi:hypothetical protein CFIICLFH_4247 [Methylobacterium goesingense]|nr:hypothetical protein CFIICLFH_4247 [Methylobacterium goesingense]